MARPSAYETKVKPHLPKIKKWVEAGATLDEIADALDIGKSTLCTYRNKYKELQDAFARGRTVVICDIKAALLKKALGFYYDETRSFVKEDLKNGTTTYTEKTRRYCVPSETAAAMLLRNYDETWRDGDSISVKMKQQEQELKKRIAEAKNWLESEENGE